MKRAAFAVPGNLDTPTGGYAYDKRIIGEMRALGWQIDVVNLPSSFPMPDRVSRAAALAKLEALPAALPIVVDGLAFGAMAEEAARLCDRNPLVALVHHPLALETGLDAAAADALRASERAALSVARASIVTSAQTAEILKRDYAVPAARLSVIRPGIDIPPPRERRRGNSVNLFAVGSITPRKGYDILIGALEPLRDLPWQLTIAGDTTRSAEALARLQAEITRFNLATRVLVAGAVSDAQLAGLYSEADVFVLASLFEGYGMVFGEAIAYGLPVVATAVGAARFIVPADAGILVPPGDMDALREALRGVIIDADARSRMAQAARQAASLLPRWPDAARKFAAILEELM